MSVGDLVSKEDRPAYARFETRTIEDREASLRLGHYAGKDVDYVLLTPAGSKDEVEKPVKDWLAQMVQQVREERLPAKWEEGYRGAYERWKRGEEIPLNGVAIKGWPVASPAQQKTIIAANILTVEDLAQANGEALQRLGMGAVDLRTKAVAWLKGSKEIGTLVQENAQLQAEKRTLLNQLEGLQAKVAALEVLLPKREKAVA